MRVYKIDTDDAHQAGYTNPLSVLSGTPPRTLACSFPDERQAQGGLDGRNSCFYIDDQVLDRQKLAH